MAFNIKRNVTDALELPREVVLNLPLISIIGAEELSIENYRGIIEYNTEKIRIHTGSGIVRISGSQLCLKQMTSEMLTVSGHIVSLEFLR